jgi:CRP/FNR family transcriptional regulator, cyclic AMP receptor protein
MNGTPTTQSLAGHAFVRGMPPDYVARLADAAVAVSVPAGHRFFDEGGRATKFWLVTAGHVALDLRKPGQANLIVETMGGDDVVGLSWLSPPYEWQFGAVAVEATAAFEMDGAAVIALCDGRPEFGYEVTRRMAAVASRRLHATRIRLLDLYGAPAQNAPAR